MSKTKYINHPMWPLLHESLPYEVKQFLIHEPMTDEEITNAASISSDITGQGMVNLQERVLRNIRDNYPPEPEWAKGNAAGISYMSFLGLLALIYPKTEILRLLNDPSCHISPHKEIKDPFLLLIGITARRALNLICLGLHHNKESTGIDFLLGSDALKGMNSKKGSDKSSQIRQAKSQERKTRIKNEAIKIRQKRKNFTPHKIATDIHENKKFWEALPENITLKKPLGIRRITDIISEIDWDKNCN